MLHLKDIDTRAPQDIDKSKTKDETEKLLEGLSDLQNLLYASSDHAVLVVLQGLDASGKDGLIRKVFSRMNPQGVQVQSFKVPTEEEMKHDFLWRIHQHAPAKGMIQLFNRSHYEDVLVTRVHGWCDDKTAKERFDAINHFEELLTKHNATTILKFYLHISKEEQDSRLQERLDDATKRWKYNEKDEEEAKLWDSYRKMYEDVFENCNEVPWSIIPSDQNWYKEHLIAKKVSETLQDLKLKFPGLKGSK
ncbi:MAG: PPK2 family polyphosphate kinase [Chitinophagaceae bacterium]